MNVNWDGSGKNLWYNQNIESLIELVRIWDGISNPLGFKRDRELDEDDWILKWEDIEMKVK